MLGEDGSSKFLALFDVSLVAQTRKAVDETHLNYDKRVPVLSPSCDVLMRRVLQHPRYMISIDMTSERQKLAYLNNLRTCSKGVSSVEAIASAGATRLTNSLALLPAPWAGPMSVPDIMVEEVIRRRVKRRRGEVAASAPRRRRGGPRGRSCNRRGRCCQQ